MTKAEEREFTKTLNWCDFDKTKGQTPACRFHHLMRDVAFNLRNHGNIKVHTDDWYERQNVIFGEAWDRLKAAGIVVDQPAEFTVHTTTGTMKVAAASQDEAERLAREDGHRVLTAEVKKHPNRGIVPGYENVWVGTVETWKGLVYSCSWRRETPPTTTEVLNAFKTDRNAFDPG